MKPLFMQLPKGSTWQDSLTFFSPFLPTPIGPQLLSLKYLLNSVLFSNPTLHLSHCFTADLCHVLPTYHYFLMVSLLSFIFLQSTTSLPVRRVSTIERSRNRNFVMCPPKTFSSRFWVQFSLSHLQDSFFVMSKLNVCQASFVWKH